MILVTGGAGYIGSHTVLELLIQGYDLVVIDNLSNAYLDSLTRVQKLAGRKLEFINADIRDASLLRNVFRRFKIDGVIHFAGLKAVGDSVDDPVGYYDNNVGGTLKLLEVMLECKCRRLVFSSSATVYGDPVRLPLDELSPLSTTNPYGSTKLVIENMLRELWSSDNRWSIAVLRYFNPVGAHESGLIGENPLATPTNLMPFISQVASGSREALMIFGSDYPTPDGTGVRDYIHVVDLARGHLKALDALASNKVVLTVNLGTGRGYSVLEVVASFERASGRKIPCNLVGRRPGDVAQCYADPSYAKQMLGWQAEYDLDRMCEDSWRWQSKNPNGYKT